MKFLLAKASDWFNDQENTVQINSIEDLKKLDDQYQNQGLIVYFKPFVGQNPQIVIYDDYVE